jgi:hypothetical protein
MQIRVDEPPKNPEPMWPSLIAFAATAGIYAVMPDRLIIGGPHWLLFSIVIGLIIPGEIAHKAGKHQICRLVSYLVLTLITAAMIGCVFMHVIAIEHRSLPPTQLLSSAILLWCTNILVFACWYWRLDAGGPHKRNEREGHDEGAFLFPQMTMVKKNDSSSDLAAWSPQFMDYLFLSFNTSTALSPTDVPALSRWAKALMMIQASVSLTIIVLLAARAVNIL